MAASGASLFGARRLDPAVLSWTANDIWFGADTPRIYSNMTRRFSNHYRTKVHPLFSLAGYGSARAVRGALGVSKPASVQIVMAATAGLWISTLYILLRILLRRRLDAVVFSLLAAVSSSAVFWFVVPETYPLGSVSLLLALTLAAVASHRVVRESWYVIVSALTLSFTVTNWMAGIIATFASVRWRRALQITANAFCVVVLLWGVQKLYFPSAGFFIGDREEAQYILQDTSGGPSWAARSFFFHGMVLPALVAEDRMRRPEWPILVTQGSRPGTGTIWGPGAVAIWAALLIWGSWGLVSARVLGRFRAVLALTLLGQLGLHLVYGDETFLYSLHTTPLLVIVAAMGTLTRARLPVLFLGGALVALAGVNNAIQFEKAELFLESHGSQREIVLREMRKSRDDPWPRGSGHVILSLPGSLESQKSYHEPGGSFSPVPGSFGVSIWAVDERGNIVETSETVPVGDLRQEYVWEDGAVLPAIRTTAPRYVATWSRDAADGWTLRLRSRAEPGTRLRIAVRSVGPAGGPITSLAWRDGTLTVNDAWRLSPQPAPASVLVGEEGTPGWTRVDAGSPEWRGSGSWQEGAARRGRKSAGWGWARIDLGDAAEHALRIQGPVAEPPVDHAISTTRPLVEVDVPDPEFIACLDAQTANLLMGLVGRETRACDPLNTPVPWHRDGAYVVAALAAAGHLPVAKELCALLAEEDFSGGFGAEADAPGLAIWAIGEVSSRLRDREFDLRNWPHVRRKADLILEMISAQAPIRRAVTRPPVLEHAKRTDLDLVADPSANGLIVGRMDFHRRILFINAVSWRGLLDAAAMADRLGQQRPAERWRAAALPLAEAWGRAFRPPESEDDRTYISGLWPTRIAARYLEAFERGIEARWERLRGPDGGFRAPVRWTYFEVADAHQWLLLDRPDRAWAGVRWFWSRQASPGLYTWWEDHEESNSLGDWTRVRGWVRPPNTQPHYWTAAEMLLLQLAMLVCEDPRSDEPTLVIGAGVPASWLEHPIRVRGLRTRIAEVDWTWTGERIEVEIRGEGCRVRAGSAFGAAPIDVRFTEETPHGSSPGAQR